MKMLILSESIFIPPYLNTDLKVRISQNKSHCCFQQQLCYNQLMRYAQCLYLFIPCHTKCHTACSVTHHNIIHFSHTANIISIFSEPILQESNPVSVQQQIVGPQFFKLLVNNFLETLRRAIIIEMQKIVTFLQLTPQLGELEKTDFVLIQPSRPLQNNADWESDPDQTILWKLQNHILRGAALCSTS